MIIQNWIRYVFDRADAIQETLDRQEEIMEMLVENISLITDRGGMVFGDGQRGETRGDGGV